MHHLLRHVASPLVKQGAGLFAKRFERRDPLAAQQALFAMLVRQAASTRFGSDHGFAELVKLPYPLAYERFRRQVPIRTYADFWQEYFGPCFTDDGRGKRLLLDDVTWPGRIPLFCETSGTTAPTKFIPFSREMFAANKQAAFDLTTNYLARTPDSRLLNGRLLYMSGSTLLSSLGDDIRSGDMSAITLRFAPSFLRPFVAPSLEVSALPWEEKLDAMAALLLANRDITGISGVPPWILLLLNRCRALGKGEVPELLPGLELIIHGGTSMKPYQREFAELFGSKQPNFLELMPSSEGFMGFQVPGEREMRFTPYYGVFFEFVPFAQLDDRGRPAAGAMAVPLEEVQVGERYAVLMSTCAGLWRYHIGDTLRFTGTEPLTFEFTGRDRFLDRFEEKVTQGEVEQAVAELNTIAGVEVAEFIVGPDIDARRHLWVLAMKGVVPQAEKLALLLDNYLMIQNADYATFRSQGRVNAPLVLTVGQDLIYRWSKEVRGKLGGQSKIPHVDPTLDGELVGSLASYAGFGVSSESQGRLRIVRGANPQDKNEFESLERVS